MKTIGKALMGWGLVVLLVIGYQCSAYAITWTPPTGTSIQTIDLNIFQYTNPILLTDPTIPLIIGETTPEVLEIIGGVGIIGGSISVMGELYTSGAFTAESAPDGGAGKVSLGRIAPRPPLPLPGKDSFAGMFHETTGQYIGQQLPGNLQPFFAGGIIADGNIVFDDLELLFDSAPTAGDLLLIAYSAAGGIFINGEVTSNLGGFGQGLGFELSPLQMFSGGALLTITDNNGVEGIYSVSIPSIPEPGTMVLLGFGLLGLAGISRKKSV